jgi:hypothetical protein
MWQSRVKEALSAVNTYLGSCLGEHTMARLSGKKVWYPACVCRSLELMKQVCVGCVWIQPNTSRVFSSQNSEMAHSFSVSHVSLVHVCSGIKSAETKSAPLDLVPQSIPHISIPWRVWSAAMSRKRDLSRSGRKTGRRGEPFSRKAGALNMTGLCRGEATFRGCLGGRCGASSRSQDGSSAYVSIGSRSLPGTGGGTAS